MRDECFANGNRVVPLDDGASVDASKGPETGELVGLLEHDKNLSIAELIWSAGSPTSSDGLFNFATQVSRRELVTSHMLPSEKVKELEARAEAARAQKHKEWMVGFFYFTLGIMILVLTYKLWILNL